MRKTLLRTLLATGVLGLVAASAAYAIRLQVGEIIVIADGGFAPKKLPRHRDAPIKLYGQARFKKVGGGRPSPLRTLVIEYDRHGHVETRGLPRCTIRRIEHTTARQARRNCPGAVVGKGFGVAVVKFPEQAAVRASTPITIFNGPRRNGNPTVLGHGHLDYPAPTTYVVPIEIERINRGRYGYRTVVKLPKIANDYGSALYGRLTVGRTWRWRGRTLSFVNARCPDGRLQGRGRFAFKDGTILQGTLFAPCQVRRVRR